MTSFTGLDITNSGLRVHAIYSSGKAKCECVFGNHSAGNDNATINLIPEIAEQFGGVVFYCFSCGKTIRGYKNLKRELAKHDIEIDITAFNDIKATTSMNHEQRIFEAMQLPLAIDNEYLLGRKVTNEQIERFEIRADSDKIVFPRYSFDGMFAGITIRFQATYNGLRYLDLGDKNTPFGLNHIDFESEDVCIVEGAFGVLRLDSFGQQSIGVLGNSRFDFAGLSWFDNIYIGVDDDEAGYEHLTKIKIKLPQSKIMKPCEYDELTQDTFLSLKTQSSLLLKDFL